MEQKENGLSYHSKYLWLPGALEISHLSLSLVSVIISKSRVLFSLFTVGTQYKLMKRVDFPCSKTHNTADQAQFQTLMF